MVKLRNGIGLHHQLEEALRYLRSTTLKEFVVKHPARAQADRFFNYPYAAVEEALVNAVYHRSYEEREPIEVRVLPDQITITSYPGADRSISLADLAAGQIVSRRYRNRRIGDFLKELELTEGRGTGIPKIQRALRENGSPSAEFKTDEDRSYFTVVLPIHPEATPQVTTQATTQVTTQVSGDLDETRRAILQLCLTPQDRASLQTALKRKSIKHLREHYLKPLLQIGWLEMTEPDSPNSPTQQYRATPAGRAALASATERT